MKWKGKRHKTKLVVLTASLALAPAALAEATPTASPTSVTFARTAIGAQSAPQTVTYSVSETDPHFVGPTVSCGGEAEVCDFLITSTTCPQFMFPPGPQSCTVAVAMDPANNQPGTKTGTLRLGGSSDNPAPTIVPLTGVSFAKAKKCGKKKGKKSAVAAKKKCGKKK